MNCFVESIFALYFLWIYKNSRVYWKYSVVIGTDAFVWISHLCFFFCLVSGFKYHLLPLFHRRRAMSDQELLLVLHVVPYLRFSDQLTHERGDTQVAQAGPSHQMRVQSEYVLWEVLCR